MSLPAEHRRWILVNAVAASAVVNLTLNALIAWGSAAGRDSVPLIAAPLTGGPSTIVDTVGTLFLLPFITYLLVTAGVRREQRAGLLVLRPHPRAAGLPRGLVARAAAWGALTVGALAVPAVGILVAIDFGDLSVGSFVLYKAVFGVVLGALVTPLLAVDAMRAP